MSTVAVVLLAVAGVLLVFFAGGLLAARRRARRPGTDQRIRAADRALEEARASDRGWDREHMLAAAGQAIRESRAGYEWESLELVLVDDRPGVTEDRAHMVAAGPHGECLVVLARREGGEWFAHRVE
jgi:type II secretory pathway pseudopilin PulG